MLTRCIVAAMILLSGSFACGQHTTSEEAFPDKVILGENAFIDIGPPFGYYTVYILQAQEHGTNIERLAITPPGDVCLQPAVVTATEAHVGEALAALLGGKNPCAIPEKALHREAKRCKHCLVFSGMHVTMQVQCSTGSRVIRQEVLDRDLFEAHPGTPEYTAGTYKLLNELGDLFHSREFDTPVFPTTTPTLTQAPTDEALRALQAGAFDGLFSFADQGETLSSLYNQAQQTHRPPSIIFTGATPIAPISPELPQYPAIARAAHVSGSVRLGIVIGGQGSKNEVSGVSGSPLLTGAAADVVENWTFEPSAKGQKTNATIDFNLNCAAKPAP